MSELCKPDDSWDYDGCGCYACGGRGWFVACIDDFIGEQAMEVIR